MSQYQEILDRAAREYSTYLSVIYIGFMRYTEMLIPKTIGKAMTGFNHMRRINRLLPLGHRFRGDVGVL